MGSLGCCETEVRGATATAGAANQARESENLFMFAVARSRTSLRRLNLLHPY